MTPLQQLADAVEAGDEAAFFDFTRKIASAHRDRGEFFDAQRVVKANDGDLNAAVRLVEALLPGWAWKRVVHPGPISSVGVWEPPKFVMGQVAHEVNGNTARALLLATLRAKIGDNAK